MLNKVTLKLELATESEIQHTNYLSVHLKCVALNGEDSSEDVVGDVEYQLLEHGSVGRFKWVVRREFEEKGLDKQILDLTCRYLFETLNVQVIVQHVLPDNERMRTALESYPFKYVGYVRESAADTQRHENGETSIDHRLCLIFELTKNDFAGLQQCRMQSGRLSYGIDKPAVLQVEKARLGRQAKLPAGELHTFLAQRFPNQPIRIIDLGCGTGELLASLRDVLPHAHLTGVDEEESFIEIAREKHQSKDIAFRVGNFLPLAEDLYQHDVFVMRFVAQHVGLQGVEKLLADARNKVPKDALLCVIDADNRTYAFEPDLPELRILLDASQSQQLLHGGDRNVGLKVGSLALRLGLDVEFLSGAFVNSINSSHAAVEEVLDTLFYRHFNPEYLSPSERERMLVVFEKWKTLPHRIAALPMVTTILKMRSQSEEIRV